MPTLPVRSASAAIPADEPTQLQRPKYFLKSHTKSRHIDESMPSEFSNPDNNCSPSMASRVTPVPKSILDRRRNQQTYQRMNYTAFVVDAGCLERKTQYLACQNRPGIAWTWLDDYSSISPSSNESLFVPSPDQHHVRGRFVADLRCHRPTVATLHCTVALAARRAEYKTRFRPGQR